MDLEDLLEKKLREFKETSKKRKAKDHEKWIALQESMKDITSSKLLSCCRKILLN